MKLLQPDLEEVGFLSWRCVGCGDSVSSCSPDVDMGDTIDLGCKRSGCVCSFIKRQESAIKAEDGSRDEPGPQITLISWPLHELLGKPLES